MKSWDEAQRGTTLLVKRVYRERPFRMIVERVERLSDTGRYAFVVGSRLRLDGSPSRLRASAGLGPGLRRELLYLNDVEIATN